MASNGVVEALGLTKWYGQHRALVDLDLQVPRGEILGFLGPNGAGKTTTIRLLLGFLKPTMGSAQVFGLDAWTQSVRIKRRVGYLPGDARFYEAMTGRAFLSLLSRLRGAEGAPSRLAERLGLDLDRRVKAYSKGMKQKLGLIQALMHDPDLMILDEPTSSLDPLVQEEVYQILRERRDEGRTIFFSSHILPEVQKVCDRVAIVRGGRLLREATVKELQGLDVRRAVVELDRLEECYREMLEAGFAVESLDGRLEVRVQEVDRLVKLLAKYRVRTLQVEPVSLEEVFLEMYRDEGAS